MFCGPSKFHFTGSLGRIKSCLEKQKTWKLGHYIHLQRCCNTERDEGNRRGNGMISSYLIEERILLKSKQMSIKTAPNKTPTLPRQRDMVEFLKHVKCKVVLSQTLNPKIKGHLNFKFNRLQSKHFNSAMPCIIGCFHIERACQASSDLPVRSTSHLSWFW